MNIRGIRPFVKLLTAMLATSPQPLTSIVRIFLQPNQRQNYTCEKTELEDHLSRMIQVYKR